MNELSGLIAQIEKDQSTDTLTTTLLEEMKWLEPCLHYLSTVRSSFPPLSHLRKRFRSSYLSDRKVRMSLSEEFWKIYSELKLKEEMMSEINEWTTYLKDTIEDIEIYGNIPQGILDKVRVLAYNLVEMSEKPIIVDNSSLEEYIMELCNLMEELEITF